MRTIGILLAVAACDGGGSDDGKGPVEDCPGATTEVCNGVDDDCDGTVDEGVAIRSWADADGDGFGDPDAAAEGCAPPAGSALRADDCDDAQTAVHPGATEVCNERDDDCDGSTDENVTVTWFVDEDRDGFGGSGTAEGCATPDDGSALTGDCDDADPSVGPGAVETCDGVDQDCDGTIDEGAGVSLWPDADGDGYGNAADGPAEVCVGTPGWVGNGDDCDDGRADVFMGAPEVCDGVDQDCDSVLDEGTLLQRWADDDGDGYGDPAELHIACADADGWVANHEDCDDAEPLAHTGAGEGCDGVDNDCDGDVDEGLAIRWYPDGDGDGFGDAASEQWSCAAAAGAAFVDGDCDDGDGGVHPRAVEVCDTVDQDCDGRVDEGLTTIWWPDVDADGWGADGGEQETCVPPPDAAFRAGDCLDTDSTAHPGALEVCDTVDDDCDGLVDDGVTRLFWTDADGDGFGAVGAPVAIDCDGGPDTSMVGGDCDDGDAGIGGPTCPPDLAGDFGTFGVDDGRTGHAPGLVGGGTLVSKWTQTLGSAVYAPAIADGQVVLMVTTWPQADRVIALDAVTGAEAWSLPFVDDIPYGAGPSVEDGVVYVQHVDAQADGEIVAIDQATGAKLWVGTFDTQWFTWQPPLVTDLGVFAGAGTYGGVAGFDKATGAALWWQEEDMFDQFTPVAQDGLVWTFIGDALDGRDPLTGVPQVTVAFAEGGSPYSMYTVPAMADGLALVVAGDDLVLVDLDTYQIVWTAPDGFSGSPTLANGVGYAIRSGAVVQVDLDDGAVLRTYPGDGSLWAGKPVVTDDAVIFSSYDQTFVYQLWDGVLLDSLAFGGEIAVGDGLLVVVDGADVWALEWQ